MTSSRGLVHAGAVVVVLVNYGRFWADLIAFFVRPFKEGPFQGLAFLFPPYTVYYLFAHWDRMKPILRRMLTSCIPIALVILAYAFLAVGQPGGSRMYTMSAARLKIGTEVLEKDIHGGLKQIEERVIRIAGEKKESPPAGQTLKLHIGATGSRRVITTLGYNGCSSGTSAGLVFQGRDVKIYLLLIDHERFFFYSDPSDDLLGLGRDGRFSRPPRSGCARLVSGRVPQVQVGLETPAFGCDALDAASLGLAAHVGPSGRSDAGEAVEGPNDRSAPSRGPARRTKSATSGKATLASNGGVTWSGCCSMDRSPPLPSLVLWILPGPNLIGYWFAYRAIHHLLVVWGIRRVRRDVIPTELHPLTALDSLIERDDDGKATHAAIDGRGGTARRARGLAPVDIWNQGRTTLEDGSLDDMRLLSYNIHKGIGGRDRRYRLERIIQVIEDEQPGPRSACRKWTATWRERGTTTSRGS